MSSDQRAPRRPRHTAEMIAQRIRARRPWRRGIAAILLVATLAAVSSMSVATPRAGAVAPRLVLVGDVRTTDPTWGMAMSAALRAELQAAPDVKVLGEARVRETLRLMHQPDTARLIGPLALDVAQRLGVPLVVTASIVLLGGGAQIVMQVIDVSSGTALATITERPVSPEDVVPAVARVASKLRARVSGPGVPDSLPRLPAFTTSPGPPVLPRGIWRVSGTESELLSALNADTSPGVVVCTQKTGIAALDWTHHPHSQFFPGSSHECPSDFHRANRPRVHGGSVCGSYRRTSGTRAAGDTSCPGAHDARP